MYVLCYHWQEHKLLDTCMQMMLAPLQDETLRTRYIWAEIVEDIIDNTK